MSAIPNQAMRLPLNIAKETDDRSPTVLAQIVNLYERHGFDAGHASARRSLVQSMVTQAELFLKHNTDGSDATRRLVYRFVEHLQRDLNKSRRETYFADGEGI